MSRRPRNELASFVDASRPTNRRLQLMHTTDGYGIRDIIEDARLSAIPRESFDNEPVLFLFYGRPAYRVATSHEPTSNRFFLPCCLIMSPDSAPLPTRMYPFDTGAYENGLYDHCLHPRMHRDDFRLTPSSDVPERFVARFFGSNENYYAGIPLPDIDASSLSFEIEAFVKIITQEVNATPDDRRATLEVHLDEDLILGEHNLETVILPSIFLDDIRVFRFFVEHCKAELLPYRVYHFRVTEYTSEIYELARKFLGLDPSCAP